MCQYNTRDSMRVECTCFNSNYSFCFVLYLTGLRYIYIKICALCRLESPVQTFPLMLPVHSWPFLPYRFVVWISQFIYLKEVENLYKISCRQCLHNIHCVMFIFCCCLQLICTLVCMMMFYKKKNYIHFQLIKIIHFVAVYVYLKRIRGTKRANNNYGVASIYTVLITK